jgi:hypothetical protein
MNNMIMTVCNFAIKEGRSVELVVDELVVDELVVDELA